NKYIKEKLFGKIQWNIDEKNDYVEFCNAKEANEWGTNHYSSWAEKHNAVMESAKNIVKISLCTDVVECYCGYSYVQINQFLREGKDTENNLYREMADILSMVLSSAPRIPRDIVVYRMVNDDFINMLITNNKKENPTPVQEKGFMSTSLLKNIASENESYATENNLLKIYVPKDTIGIYVNVITKRKEEEILLFPNMYLGLSYYPYKDHNTGTKIYECKLIKLCQ
ncbi:MAG: ADP-ribosyltransferase, partial [Clostridia bacterium]